MTGLDRDMMQKNLTCKTLREAQKDMCSYGFAFVPANLLFLSLGVLLMMLAKSQGMALPEKPDDLLPMFAASGSLGICGDRVLHDRSGGSQFLECRLCSYRPYHQCMRGYLRAR